MQKIWKFIISLLIPQIVGVIGSLFTMQAIPIWYAGLYKASFNPPNWVFGPAWFVLYILMGLALFIVWEKCRNKRELRYATSVFAVQLALNLLWTIIFFGFKSPAIAFAEIIFLWGAILLTMANFYKISKTAAYLMVPYLLWVTFAVVLNLMIVILN